VAPTNSGLEAELTALDARMGVKVGPPGEQGVTWQRERAALEQRRVALPDAQTTFFALFLVEQQGVDGELSSVEPA
jgi:hypothetical protein